MTDHAVQRTAQVNVDGQSPLVATAPRLPLSRLAEVAGREFGVEGRLRPLDAERDQNVRIDAADGRAYVLKVANPADDETVIDLQNAAMLHIAACDPELPIPQLMASANGERWYTIESEDGTRHLARLMTLLPGRNASPAQLDGEALHAFGATVARMGRALRGFFHPAARYDILWDLRHTARLRELLPSLRDPEEAQLVGTALDRFDAEVAPGLAGLRAQVIHNDLTLDNVLLDDRNRVSGIVDFGDVTHTALVFDLAIALAGLIWKRPDPLGAADRVIAGYQSVTSLEDDELRILLTLVESRLAAWVTIASWRVEQHPDNAAYILGGVDDAWRLLDEIQRAGPRAARQLHETAVAPALPYTPAPTGPLLARRRGSLFPTPLSYEEPLHLVRGEGVWLHDADGNRYLDAYNNVPVVGHCHPAVAEAVAAQTRRLATNTRYLHEAVVELAERLTATLPDGLDTVLLVNSGSEANDLALRLARRATGAEGALVTDHAYHGVTTAITDLSPEIWPDGYTPAHVQRHAPPGREPTQGSEWRNETVLTVGDAVAALSAAGHHLAAAFLDPGCTSDGIVHPSAGSLERWEQEVRSAGGLVVIDEVQTGHARCGPHLWGFQASAVIPDVVTMGKPMGNGFPVAAVVTHRELADELATSSELFSTYGGNPVACAAALAVLDVIEREDLTRHSASVGDLLGARLQELARDHAAIAQVRQRGLLIGVELVDGQGEPDGRGAAQVANHLRRDGVLIGTAGRHGNVLKIRPPLIFEESHVDRLVAVLSDALDALMH